MKTLRTSLCHKLAGAKKIAVLGIGSTLRADDAAGILAATHLKKSLAKRKTKSAVKIFLGETAPENLTGEIKRFKPSHLIIIDTADLHKRPGAVFVFTPQEVGGGVSFSTHKMPARILVDYLIQSLGCEVAIIGIQPKSIDFGKGISRAVESSAKKAAAALAAALP